MLTYRDSEWAVRRWDWFNAGRVVEPLSFCQFWRTVLLYATVRLLFLPLIWLSALLNAIPVPNFTLPTPPRQLVLAPLKGCWLLLRLAIRTLWLLAYPLRLVAKPVGRGTLAGVVNTGERLGIFYQHHQTVLDYSFVGLMIVCYGTIAILFLIVALLASWFWTLLVIGAVTVGGFAIYGFIKSGALGLLWQAGVATHHGICPPVKIEREP